MYVNGASGGQVVQEALCLAAAYFPPGQSVHPAAELLVLPIPHGEHSLIPDSKVPYGQHVVRSPPEENV